jgi:hypothetical protein
MTAKRYKKTATKSSFKKEKTGFNLVISTDTQIALSKGIILGLIVIAMVILAYHKIFEPVVWSSLVITAGYVAFTNRRNNTNS